MKKRQPISNTRNPEPLNVIFASSEALPYVKTGGLADVGAALPTALRRKGVSVTCFLPLYGQIDQAKHFIKPVGKEISVPISDRHETAQLYQAEYEGVTSYFISHDHYFNRPGLYGTQAAPYQDNAERFIFFSRAVLEGAKILGLKPDVVHCNDWHTALIPLYLKTAYAAGFPNTASLFTIHNLGYQGLFWHLDWHLLNLSWDYFNFRGLEFYGEINFLKGGLYYADLISTVSVKYTKEIQTPDFGHGLDGVLRDRTADLYGILNGLDTIEWNPGSDPHIAATYDITDLSGKQACKAALQKEFELPVVKKTPLFAIITRLVEQKGLRLIAGVIEKLLQKSVQLIVLGTGEKEYETLLQGFATRYPDKMSVRITYDSNLSHRIEAGADIFLMPSRYEPCGLNQMMSLRYGTVPIVRATGGLDDTVKIFNQKTGKGNGFKFKAYTESALLKQINKARALFEDKKTWRTLMKNGMAGDYSWDRSSKTYIKHYRQLKKTIQEKR